MGVQTDGTFITAEYKKKAGSETRKYCDLAVIMLSWFAAALPSISFTLSVSITVFGTGASSRIWYLAAP
mgnify:CR=1 FL=1